jgi:hypothetical protein
VTGPGHLHLSSASLLSKWGFNGGDLPDHVWDHMDEIGIAYDAVDWHAALRALVRAHLLPEVEKHHTIEVYDITTIHNPIRAAVVDGMEIDDYSPRPQVDLKPDGVDVPMATVIEALEATRGQ